MHNIIKRLTTALERGNTCLFLSEYSDLAPSLALKELCQTGWVAVCENIDSIPYYPIIAIPIEHDYILYITRYAYYEITVLKTIMACNKSYNNIPLTDDIHTEQNQAIKNTLLNQFSIITGGPGTGKTTIIKRLLQYFIDLYGEPIMSKITICAPTGKAVAKLKQATNHSNCGTIHKILGYIPLSIYFKHDIHNKLPAEIIIVDEASMVSLPLFYKLLSAIDTNIIKHLILIGDANQLLSVDEGSVFVQLIKIFIKNVNYLQISYRNTPQLQSLAHEVLEGKFNYSIIAPEMESVVNNITPYLKEYFNLISPHNIMLSFNYLRKFAILCATNDGKLGTAAINSKIDSLYNAGNVWYTGKPIIILENHYTLDLYNGDLGICVIEGHHPKICFENGRILEVNSLPKHDVAFATTIHKAQGSEYDHVCIVMPTILPLVNRRLLYTAITRAKKTLTVFSYSNVINCCLEQLDTRTSSMPYLYGIFTKRLPEPVF